ncbi:MAG: hypothetical protein ACJ8EB_03850 [Allosphingosinicella sp.]
MPRPTLFAFALKAVLTAVPVALLAAVPMAAPAAAPPSGMVALPIGVAPGPHAGFGGGFRGGFDAGFGGVRFGAGAGPGHGRFRFMHGRHRHGDRRDDYGAAGYGAAGYAGGVPLAEDYPTVADGGFFGDGGALAARGGHVLYDYDRGYPYEYYRTRRDLPAIAYETAPLPAPARCVTERVPGGPVRICRR